MTGNSETNLELLEFFLDFLKTKSRKSLDVISSISRDLEKFIEYLSINKLELDAESIRGYLAYLQENYNLSTYKVKLSSLRQFTKWLNLEDNPFDENLTLKTTPNEAAEDFYTKAELLEKLSKIKDPIELLFCELLFELCLSPSELLKLKVLDFNFATASFRLRFGAATENAGLGVREPPKLTEIKLSDGLALRLKQFLKMKEGLSLDAVIFTGIPELDSEVKIAKLLKKHDIQAKKLKRSRIVHLLEDGLSIQALENNLGIKVPANYLSLAKETKDYKLLKAFKEFHPRA
ncbi:MAG: site-specific integrase [Candidatus Melainabacteria bacterium]|nr:site-specific integrase [Candidatus Melainabacteria bacterium]